MRLVPFGANSAAKMGSSSKYDLPFLKVPFILFTKSPFTVILS